MSRKNGHAQQEKVFKPTKLFYFLKAYLEIFQKSILTRLNFLMKQQHKKFDNL